MILDVIEGVLLLFILIALCVINIPYKNMDIAYRKIKMNEINQKQEVEE